jgi:folate-dependent phosphoribosylglycinamide formyltransferase PurN
MRIVVAAGIDLAGQHFASTLIRRFGPKVVGVIFQRPPGGVVRRRRGSVLRRGIGYVFKHGFSPLRIWRDRRFVRLLAAGAAGAAETRQRFFPVDQAALAGFAGRMWTTFDIHQAQTVAAIRELSPEVICILGGAVLRPEILAIPPLGVINIHTGRIPDYRGVRCTEWAILNDDLDRLAVTVHFAEARVDRGRIIAQDTIPIEADDDEVSLECKLIRAGIDRVCDALLRLNFGSLPTRPVLEAGRLLLARHWSRDRYVELKRKIQQGAIRRHVHHNRQTAAGPTRDPEPSLSH